MGTKDLGSDILQARIHSASLIQYVKYANVASCTILVWEYLQTIQLEISLVWPTRANVMKILYFVARYPTFFDTALQLYTSLAEHSTPSTCHTIYSISAWSTVVGIGTAETILCFRTYALWGASRKMMIFLVVMMVSFHIVVITIMEVFLKSLKFGQLPLPEVMNGCYATEGSSILFVDFALVMLGDLILMSLTLWVGLKRYRNMNNPLLRVIFRDGALYFICLFIIGAGNVIVLTVGPVELVDLLNTFQRIMHSVLSCRVVLHMRQAAIIEEFVTFSHVLED